MNLTTSETHGHAVSPDNIDLLRKTVRNYFDHQKDRITLSNRMSSRAARILGIAWSENPKERTKQQRQAQTFLNNVLKGNEFFYYDTHFKAPHECLKTLLKREQQICREMEAEAKKLPVWETWAKNVHGFGAAGLAKIVGEAGDLGNYSGPGKLNTRFGLGSKPDKRDGEWKIQKNCLFKGMTEEDARFIAYNKRRRSIMFNIVEPLIKAKGDYYQRYLTRKEYERAKAPQLTKGHTDARAKRWLAKELLKELWIAWNHGRHETQDCFAQANSQEEVVQV